MIIDRQIKYFTGVGEPHIRSATASIGAPVFVATLSFNVLTENRTMLTACFSRALLSFNESDTVTNGTWICITGIPDIKRALTALKEANLISERFCDEIAKNFPKPYSGTMDIYQDPLPWQPVALSHIDFDMDFSPVANRVPRDEANIGTSPRTELTGIRELLRLTRSAMGRRPEHEEARVFPSPSEIAFWPQIEIQVQDNLSPNYRDFIPEMEPRRRIRHPFRRFNASSLPADNVLSTQGENAEKLAMMKEFKAENIPREYCCAISFEIMSDPVYDPRQPNVFYERKNIVKWLQQECHYTNPYTREALAPTQLKSANLLQVEIEEFIEAIIEKEKPLPKGSIPISALLKGCSLFHKLADDFITDNRHRSDELQEEYDRRHGLILG